MNRLAPEMAEIGIQRLAAGHRQEDRAQGHQTDQPWVSMNCTA